MNKHKHAAKVGAAWSKIKILMNSNDKFNEDPERYNEDPERLLFEKDLKEFGRTEADIRHRQRIVNRLREFHEPKEPPFNYAPKLNGILNPWDPEKEYIKDCGGSLIGKEPEPKKYTRAQLRELIASDYSVKGVSWNSREPGEAFLIGANDSETKIIIIPEAPKKKAIGNGRLYNPYHLEK